MSSYETVSWDTAGTYTWTVPEGVTRLNVTTVGAGGGVGYLKAYLNVATSGTMQNMFSGGNGGDTIAGTIITVTSGDVIPI